MSERTLNVPSRAIGEPQALPNIDSANLPSAREQTAEPPRDHTERCLCPDCREAIDKAIAARKTAEPLQPVENDWSGIPEDLTAPAPPAAPLCDCGAGNDAYLACHADKCALNKYAQPKCGNCARLEAENAQLRQLVRRTRTADYREPSLTTPPDSF